MSSVTPPHCSAQVLSPTRTKVCVPGVVSPPFAATCRVLVNQVKLSGVPLGFGAVFLTSDHGATALFTSNPFQSPTRTRGFVGNWVFCQSGGIVSKFHKL